MLKCLIPGGRCCPPLAAMLLTSSVVAAATPASAQDHRADAEAYPCSQESKLALVQQGNDFVIRAAPLPSADNPSPARPAQPRTVRIGSAIAFDAVLFDGHTHDVREAVDAARP